MKQRNRRRRMLAHCRKLRGLRMTANLTRSVVIVPPLDAEAWASKNGVGRYIFQIPQAKDI